MFMAYDSGVTPSGN